MKTLICVFILVFHQISNTRPQKSTSKNRIQFNKYRKNTQQIHKERKTSTTNEDPISQNIVDKDDSDQIIPEIFEMTPEQIEERKIQKKQEYENDQITLNKNKDKYRMCNPVALKTIGMSIKPAHYSSPASLNELLICQQNKETCCDSDSMLDVINQVKSKIVDCKSKITHLEQLLTLFRGSTYRHYLKVIKEKTECQSEALSVLKPELREKFFEQNTIKNYISEITHLLSTHSTYLSNKNTLNINLVCTFCNPTEVRHFTFGTKQKEKKKKDQKTENNKNDKTEKNNENERNLKKKNIKRTFSMKDSTEFDKIDVSKIETTFEIDDSTCQSLITIKYYEHRYSKLLSEFLIPFATMLRCVSEMDDSTDYVIDPVDMDSLYKENRQMETCLYYSLDKKCQKYCKINILQQEFPRIMMLQSYQVYKILFLMFVENKLPAYFDPASYSKYILQKKSNNCYIYPKSGIAKTYKVAKANYLLSENGAKISQNQVSSHLLVFESGFLNVVFITVLVFNYLNN